MNTKKVEKTSKEQTNTTRTVKTRQVDVDVRKALENAYW